MLKWNQPISLHWVGPIGSAIPSKASFSTFIAKPKESHIEYEIKLA